MKKIFYLLACVTMSLLSFGQDNQLVWVNGRLLYGTPIESIDSLTYDEMQDIDTLHLLLPYTLIKVVHDTVYIHDTVYVEMGCGDEDDTSSAGIGVFSVSADKQVTFSKGNLQYHPANDEWRFAENQWDCVGDVENNNIATSYNGWIDLFGWGTGNNPLNLSQENEDYQTFVDWGINKIGNDTPNTWRTLSKDEWLYILYERTNAESLFALGNIEGKEGIIILPDYWECPSGVNFIASNTQGLIWTDLHYENIGDYTDNTYTINEWMKLESAGAIFLPAAGVREHGNANFAGYNGVYWSSSSDGNEMAYFVHFNWDWLYPQSLYYNHNGLSVRLVKNL